jgi:hypothetical protein
MREWIDEKIKYLDSRISKKYAIFEPTREFYEILGNIDVIPPLEEVLDNIDKNKSPYMTASEATESVAKHLGGTVPKIVFRQMQHAGRYQVGQNKRDIEISNDYKKKGKQLGTIIAHEITHDYLFSKQIILKDTHEHERLTDLASVMLGLGKLMLNGIEEKSFGRTKRLCYLSPSDLSYAYVKVNLHHGVPINNCLTNLTHDAFLLAKSAFNKIPINNIKLQIDGKKKKNKKSQSKIDKIKYLYNKINKNQDLLNKKALTLKIEPEDGETFVNLNNRNFHLDFERFIFRMEIELNDTNKELETEKKSISIKTKETTKQHLEELDKSINQREKETELYFEQLLDILAVQEKYFPN